MLRRAFMLAVTIILSSSAFAQFSNLQVSRQNKTISVTADGSVSVEPDIATIDVGYRNYGLTQQEAYQENLRVAERIVKVITDAGIKPENVQTDRLRVTQVDPEDSAKWAAEVRKQRQYEVEQSWKIKVAADDAQPLVDALMRAGANNLGDVSWGVADRVALQAKASAEALTKARAIAEQMAKGLGAKLGELVYASNHAQVVTVNASLATVATRISRTQPPPKLNLFRQKVTENGTVMAVFALE